MLSLMHHWGMLSFQGRKTQSSLSEIASQAVWPDTESPPQDHGVAKITQIK